MPDNLKEINIKIETEPMEFLFKHHVRIGNVFWSRGFEYDYLIEMDSDARFNIHVIHKKDTDKELPGSLIFAECYSLGRSFGIKKEAMDFVKMLVMIGKLNIKCYIL